MFRLLAVLRACLLIFTIRAQMILRERIVDIITNQFLEDATVSEISKPDSTRPASENSSIVAKRIFFT